jgi:hypothetical protein
MTTGMAHHPDIRTDTHHFPHIAAAGMLLLESNHIPQPDFHDHD